jgi:glycosyl transferase family 87
MSRATPPGAPPPEAAIRRAGLVVFGLALFAAAGILASRPLGYDFAAYWNGARHLLEGAPLYPAAGAQGGVFLGFGEFLYEPLVAVAFIPLALLPFEVAAWLWTGLLVVLATALGTVLVLPFRSALRPWAAAAYALFFPLLADITLGNLNLVTVVLALAAWNLRGRPRAAGAVLAAAIGLKLLPVALLLFYAAARRWRIVGWSVATGAAAVALSMPFLADRWAEYLRLFAAVTRESSEFAINVIPAGLGDPPLRYVLPIAALMVAVWAGREEHRGASGSAHHVALAAAPLVSPLVWYPYLIFVAPALWGAAVVLAGPGRYAAIAAFIALELPSGRSPFPDVAFAGLLAVLVIAALAARGGTRGETRSRPADGSSHRTASSQSGHSGTA